MIEFLKANRTVIGGVIVAVLGLYSYFTYFSGSSSAVISSDEAVSPASQQLLLTLGRLNTIKLDESIFADAVFLSLSDFGVTIPPENIGRRNPFAPVGASSGTTTQVLPAGE